MCVSIKNTVKMVKKTWVNKREILCFDSIVFMLKGFYKILFIL